MGGVGTTWSVVLSHLLKSIRIQQDHPSERHQQAIYVGTNGPTKVCVCVWVQSWAFGTVYHVGGAVV